MPNHTRHRFSEQLRCTGRVYPALLPDHNHEGNRKGLPRQHHFLHKFDRQITVTFSNFELDVFQIRPNHTRHRFSERLHCTGRVYPRPFAPDHNHKGQPQGDCPYNIIFHKFDRHYIINLNRATARDCPYKG